MTGADIGGLATGITGLLTALGVPPILRHRSERRMERRIDDVKIELRRELDACEDRNADNEFIIGVLIDLLPGGELASRFSLRPPGTQNQEYVKFVAGLRKRHGIRVERRLRETGFTSE